MPEWFWQGSKAAEAAGASSDGQYFSRKSQSKKQRNKQDRPRRGFLYQRTADTRNYYIDFNHENIPGHNFETISLKDLQSGYC